MDRQSVSLVEKKTIGKNYNADIFSHVNTIQQGGMRIIAKCNVQGAMFLGMESNIRLEEI